MGDRSWDVDALTMWGNVIAVREAVHHVSNDTQRQSLYWAYSELERQYEDEIGWGQYLTTENSENEDFVNMLDSCKFANGRELTGNLEEWIMNDDNEYQR